VGKRAAIYARISDDPTGKQAGVTRQVEDSRALADLKGFEVVGEYVDNDVSAFNGARRPEFERMLEAVRSGAIEVIVTWHHDRLVRRLTDLERIVALVEDASLTVATVEGGDLNLNSEQGKLIARLMVSVASYESGHKARRVARAMEQRAKEGKPQAGGGRPYGFETDKVTIRADEARVIREAADRVLAGETTHSIARDFEARGIVSPAGKPWLAPGLSRILRAPRMAALRAHKGVVVGKGNWKPIISAETHARLVVVLDRPRAPEKGGRTHLLSGILKCGKCGRGLAGRIRHGPDRTRYECYGNQPGRAGCGRLMINADKTDAFVVGSVLDVLAASKGLPLAINALERDQVSDVLAEVATLTSRRNEMAKERALGTLDAAEWRAAREAIDERLATLHASATVDPRAAALAKVSGLDRAELEAAWERLGLEQRRVLITAVVGDSIVIAPSTGHRFDPDRIQVRA
jgi:DNA invertase Pin-like site-specific DNA recombinase